MQSIERINKRLKGRNYRRYDIHMGCQHPDTDMFFIINDIIPPLPDHFVRPTPPHTSEYNYPVPPSTPPKRQNNGRTRGNTPKYGIHHTPPRLVATNYRSVNSRTPSKLADQ